MSIKTKTKTDINISTLPTALTPTVVLVTYLEWLNKQPLADNTRRTYRVRASTHTHNTAVQAPTVRENLTTLSRVSRLSPYLFSS